MSKISFSLYRGWAIAALAVLTACGAASGPPGFAGWYTSQGGVHEVLDLQPSGAYVHEWGGADHRMHRETGAWTVAGHDGPCTNLRFENFTVIRNGPERRVDVFLVCAQKNIWGQAYLTVDADMAEILVRR